MNNILIIKLYIMNIIIKYIIIKELFNLINK